MPASDYIASASWDDAKVLFNEKTRTYTGSLPRMMYWAEDDSRWNADGSVDTAAVKRRFLYDMGFYNVHISTALISSFGLAVDGFVDIEDYIIKNNAPWTMLAPNISAHAISSGASPVHPCWVSTGNHIGNIAGCAPGINPTENSAFRFQTSLGVPESPISSDGVHFTVPTLPESIGFWTAMEQYTWDNHGWKGQKYVDYINASNPRLPNPIGMMIDYEDYIDGWELGVYAALYSTDPRFNFSSNEHVDVTYARNLSQMLDSRYQILISNNPYIMHNKDILIFERNFALTHRFSSYTNPPTLSSTGRKKGCVIVYPGGSSFGPTLVHVLNDIGTKMFDASTIDMHVFGSWFTAGLAPLSPYDNPSVTPSLDINIALTIAQTVGVIKLMMATGSELLGIYNNPANPRHQYPSVAVAYDEMQQYADFIKSGINYIPPFDNNKAPLFVNNDKKTQWMTCYYGKESDGTIIPDGVFINCRILNNRMLFVGLRVNDKGNNTTSSTHTIMSPTMEEVIITASPEGTITVI